MKNWILALALFGMCIPLIGCGGAVPDGYTDEEVTEDDSDLTEEEEAGEEEAEADAEDDDDE